MFVPYLTLFCFGCVSRIVFNNPFTSFTQKVKSASGESTSGNVPMYYSLILLEFRRVRHGIDKLLGHRSDGRVKVEGESLAQRWGIQPRVGIRGEQDTIHIVRDASSVLHFGDHVLQRRPGQRPRVQMSFQKHNRDTEITRVEFIRNIPSQRFKFTSFLNDGMEKNTWNTATFAIPPCRSVRACLDRPTPCRTATFPPSSQPGVRLSL